MFHESTAKNGQRAAWLAGILIGSPLCALVAWLGLFRWIADLELGRLDIFLMVICIGGIFGVPAVLAYNIALSNASRRWPGRIRQLNDILAYPQVAELYRCGWRSGIPG